MHQRVIAKRFFDGQNWHQNKGVQWQDGRITAIIEPQSAHEQCFYGMLVPGFIDVQVNGGGGVLFNATPTVQALSDILQAHSAFGTTAMLPTLITDELLVIEKAADAVARAIAANVPGILGVHFEGPHLSVPKRGIHKSEFIRPPSDAELALYCRQDLGKVILTIAPETVPVDIIRELVSKGVRVCLGHSNADAETVIAALEAGASGFTHLFNAMSPMQSRAPGMVGTALADDNSYCGLILDHHHVHSLCAKVAIKAKGASRIMLVTDAMAHVGSSNPSLPYFDVEIHRVGDKLTLDDGTLAGSALDMATAVRHCHRDLGFPLENALQMASSSPAAFLGLGNELGALKAGYRADMVLLDDNLQVQQSWIGGHRQQLQGN
ncbi:N-acetylglucosamine-6-phosphate deacetylase [Aliiglaciecola sp. CAU 1673]|uniref:N-acetylglucosamine-6-phosphate deacetylase n=1 Tax=Aliiglaciecola sp. CAU 1673 TaxID=3032595 RepID=UPI0023DBCF49|nr:N-acetylglucosamine-6-phosphate deacetylase [Aliiglaciecola sp. CAU 1673]MDF2179873.1 N-acetylglucosamine-6-phosphate deacetylase [Aliiglaciecola sp. CAU 1673]